MPWAAAQLYAWGYTYVENLTWVWMRADNSILRLPGTFCRRSHLTLIVFRREGARAANVAWPCVAQRFARQPRHVRACVVCAWRPVLPSPAGEGRGIQLRHQRSADVIFDCLRHDQGEPARWQQPASRGTSGVRAPGA